MVGCIVPAPALAAPRVTLKLEGSTLHGTLKELQRQTGMQFRSQDGAGDEEFKEPIGARKARFEWKGTPLGVVIRDVCGAYGLTASAMGDSGFWFQPGLVAKRNEVLKDGIAFSVSSVTQSETRQIIPGQPKPRIQRNLSMRLVCRAENGDGDVIGPLTRLQITDVAGKTVDLPSGNVNDGGYGLPDERSRSVSLPWQGELPKRLLRLEGELTLFNQVQEHRFSYPLGAGLPPASQSGPVRAEVTQIRQEGRQTRASFKLSWPKDTEVAVYGSSAVRVLLKFETGRTERVYSSIQQAEEAGQRTAKFDLNASHEKLPIALEILVPSRTANGRKVAFTLENLTLPFGKPFTPRLQPLAMKARDQRFTRRPGGRGIPGLLYDSSGGTVLVPSPGAVAEPDTPVQALLALSRQLSDGSWSGSRWVTVDVGTEAGDEAARLPYLAAGNYRVRLQYWQRATEKTPAKRIAIPERAATLTVQAGQDVPIPR